MTNTFLAIAFGFCIGFFLSVYGLPQNAAAPSPFAHCYTYANDDNGRWQINLKNGYVLRPKTVKLDTCGRPIEYALVTPYLWELSPNEIDTMFFVPDSLGGDTLMDWDNMPQ